MRTKRVVVVTMGISAVFFSLNLVAFAASGSRAVLSQALYAITDIVSGLMIYWGMRMSEEPPTLVHPFGRGKERFFWAFASGLVTFSLTGFVVFAYGLFQVLDPVRILDLRADLIVVGATLVSSTTTLVIILLELRRDGTSVRALMESDHQEMKLLMVQDIIAAIGALAAITGLYLVYATTDPRFDGYAASVVGALLFGTGISFTIEARELLVGKAVSMDITRRILGIVERYPYIRGVLGMRSMLLGPEEILITLRVNFVDDLTTDDIEMHIDQLRQFVRGECPTVRYLIIEPVSERGFSTLPLPVGP